MDEPRACISLVACLPVLLMIGAIWLKGATNETVSSGLSVLIIVIVPVSAVKFTTGTRPIAEKIRIAGGTIPSVQDVGEVRGSLCAVGEEVQFRNGASPRMV